MSKKRTSHNKPRTGAADTNACVFILSGGAEKELNKRTVIGGGGNTEGGIPLCGGPTK